MAFADALADRLARAGMPRVIARASVMEAEARTRSPLRLGSELGVAWLVESTLTREHKHDLRLSVRMVSAQDAGVLWVESTIEGDDDIYRLIDRMLDTTVLRAQATLAAGGPDDGDALSGARARLPAAARAKLDAARLLLLQRTIGGADEAVALMESLTRDYPDAADAWAWLAAALYSRITFLDRADDTSIDVLRDCAARALAVDAGHPVALRTEAIIVGRRDHDVDAAEAMFRRALRMTPNYTSARLNYAELLALQGRAAETRAQLNLALIYDPLSVTVQLARAYCLGHLREYDEAREAWTLCRAGGETSAWLLIGSAMNELAAGNLAEARRQADDALARFADAPTALMASAIMHAALGDGAAAHACEAETYQRYPHYPGAQRALVAALLGEREAALAGIEAALARGDMTLQQVLVQPAFDWLAGDARLRAVRARCGVPATWEG
jgi:Tfp pilus assembly protein PilF